MNPGAAALWTLLFLTFVCIIVFTTTWDNDSVENYIFGFCLLALVVWYLTDSATRRSRNSSHFVQRTIESHNTPQTGDVESGDNTQIVNSRVRAPRESSHDLHLLSIFPRAHIARLAMRTLPPVVCFCEDQTINGGSSQRDCSICMEDFKNGELIQPFGVCVHEFHSTCINSWLFSGKTTCPICRKELSIRIF